MKNVGIETQVVWSFDRPITVTYDYFGETKSFSITGAEYRVSTHREPYLWLRGYQLLKSGRPRKGSHEGVIFPDKTRSVYLNGEWVYVETGVGAIIDQCKIDGQALLDKYYAPVV